MAGLELVAWTERGDTSGELLHHLIVMVRYMGMGRGLGLASSSETDLIRYRVSSKPDDDGRRTLVS